MLAAKNSIITDHAHNSFVTFFKKEKYYFDLVSCHKFGHMICNVAGVLKTNGQAILQGYWSRTSSN